MTTSLEQKKLIACAELDGWRFSTSDDDKVESKEGIWLKGKWGSREIQIANRLTELPPYATSLDAIVPVVIKWCGEDNERWFKFRDALEVGESSMMIIQYYMSASPSKIRDALLLAAGKMPEGDDK